MYGTEGLKASYVFENVTWSTIVTFSFMQINVINNFQISLNIIGVF